MILIKSNVFFSLVGKCINCSKSCKISINFPPSDGLKGESDLLSLLDQTISPKLKSL